MKKLIDIPDEHIPSIQKVAKSKRQSVKAYMEQIIIAATLQTLLKKK
jgi:hypothetical protein